jgi:hypothetical protein
MENIMKSFLVVALLLVSMIAVAQDNTLELMRQDLKTQKVAILTASLPMTEKQAEQFWPLYREYSNDLAKLGDRRVAAIKMFAAKYDSVDNKTADQLVKESFSIMNDRNSLLEKTYKNVAKELGSVMAARFVQVENQLLTLVDAQITSQMPLVRLPKPAEKKK